MKGVLFVHLNQDITTGRWDIRQVLDFPKQKGETADLSIKDLTIKLAMLFSIIKTNADKASDWCALDVWYLSLTPDSAGGIDKIR